MYASVAIICAASTVISGAFATCASFTQVPGDFVTAGGKADPVVLSAVGQNIAVGSKDRVAIMRGTSVGNPLAAVALTAVQVVGTKLYVALGKAAGGKLKETDAAWTSLTDVDTPNMKPTGLGVYSDQIVAAGVPDGSGKPFFVKGVAQGAATSTGYTAAGYKNNFVGLGKVTNDEAFYASTSADGSTFTDKTTLGGINPAPKYTLVSADSSGFYFSGVDQKIGVCANSTLAGCTEFTPNGVTTKITALVGGNGVMAVLSGSKIHYASGNLKAPASWKELPLAGSTTPKGITYDASTNKLYYAHESATAGTYNLYMSQCTPPTTTSSSTSTSSTSTSGAVSTTAVGSLLLALPAFITVYLSH